MHSEVTLPPLGDQCPRIWESLTSQLKEAVDALGVQDVVLGLSGGLDSSLVATLASDALGPEHVTGILMPSEFSTRSSIDDALDLAENLSIKTHTLPLHDIYDATLATLEPLFADTPTDATEENIQARIRGMLLMAYSNKFGPIVLATGNRSESLAGYATLYGDMVGAYAPISTLFKTHAYQLCKWRNEVAGFDLIPLSTLEKAPSAELSHGQQDSDSLPDYPTLDAIYYWMIDRSKDAEYLLGGGIKEHDIDSALDRQERFAFKLAYAAPGPLLELELE